MKYLTILKDLDYRGSQRVAQNYSIGMKQLGNDVRVLTTDTLGGRAQYLSEQGIVCACLALQSDSLQEICRWCPDVVHIHRPGMFDEKVNPLIFELKKKTNAIIIETSIFSRIDYKIPPNIIDVHLHLTNWCLWKWIEWAKALKYRPVATVLPYSVMHDSFYRSSREDIVNNKKKIGIPINDFVFGRIGAGVASKWHPVTIEAFKRVAEKRGDVSLLLVDPAPFIQKQVKALPENIYKKVFMRTKVESDADLRLLYSTIDVFLHASRIGEGFGMVLAESLLCETPVVTLSTPLKDNGQTEVVEHNKTGIIANSEEAFICAAEEICHKRDRVIALGRQGRTQMLARFNNDYICSQIALLCEVILKCRGGNVEEKLRLLESHGFLTKIDSKDILATLNAFKGQVSFFEKLMIRAVHQPLLYKFYICLKEYVQSFLNDKAEPMRCKKGADYARR